MTILLDVPLPEDGGYMRYVCTGSSECVPCTALELKTWCSSGKLKLDCEEPVQIDQPAHLWKHSLDWYPCSIARSDGYAFYLFQCVNLVLLALSLWYIYKRRTHMRNEQYKRVQSRM